MASRKLEIQRKRFMQRWALWPVTQSLITPRELGKVGHVFRFNADWIKALSAFPAKATGMDVHPGGAMQTQLVLFLLTVLS